MAHPTTQKWILVFIPQDSRHLCTSSSSNRKCPLALNVSDCSKTRTGARANGNDSRTYSLVRVLSHPPISLACRSWKISEWLMHQRSLRMKIQISPSSVCHPSRFNLYHSVSRPSLPKTTTTSVFVDGSSHLTSAPGPIHSPSPTTQHPLFHL